MTAFVANTNVLDLIGLKNEIADSYINDADVTVTIKDAGSVDVVGETWPLTMAYVAASSGDYRAILSDTLEFAAKTKYLAYITADGGPDLMARWTYEFKPITRTGTP